jgi:hypothetical protein
MPYCQNASGYVYDNGTAKEFKIFPAGTPERLDAQVCLASLLILLVIPILIFFLKKRG